MSEWKWWASFDGGERCSVGPEDTRESVIAAAILECGGRSFEILEATQATLRLAGFVDVDRMVEDAE